MTTLTERRRKEIASLARKKGRDELGQFLLEGLRAVDSALSAGAALVDCVVGSGRAGHPDIARLTARMQCPIHVVPDHVFERLSGVEHAQGILATSPVPVASTADFGRSRGVIALDGVQDPGNVGTILRSAAWFGPRAVLAGDSTADWYSPKVVRASMGALFDLDLERTDDLSATLERWAGDGRQIWLADLRGESVAAWRPSGDAVLVFGSEGNGVTASVARHATGRVTIPAAAGARGTESLNVSAAAAVLLYAWATGRGERTP